MGSGARLASLVWTQAETRLRSDPVVVIPVGAALKEHGYHLPLDNDFRFAERLADRLLAVEDVLVTPTVAFGPYPAFTEYPGSVSIDGEAFVLTLRGIVESLARHGARRFYVLNTGISTVRWLERLTEQVTQMDLRLEFMDLRRDGSHMRHAVEQQARGTHADEIETSIMLELAPETVRLELAVPEVSLDRGPGGLTRDSTRTTGVHSRSGAWGDPTLASAAKGRALVEDLLKDVRATIAKLRD